VKQVDALAWALDIRSKVGEDALAVVAARTGLVAQTTCASFGPQGMFASDMKSMGNRRNCFESNAAFLRQAPHWGRGPRPFLATLPASFDWLSGCVAASATGCGPSGGGGFVRPTHPVDVCEAAGLHMLQAQCAMTEAMQRGTPPDVEWSAQWTHDEYTWPGSAGAGVGVGFGKYFLDDSSAWWVKVDAADAVSAVDVACSCVHWRQGPVPGSCPLDVFASREGAGQWWVAFRGPAILASRDVVEVVGGGEGDGPPAETLVHPGLRVKCPPWKTSA
jgi:hypothetical protein